MVDGSQVAAADGSGNQAGEEALAIRWLIRRDTPDVVRIDMDSFVVSWGENDFMETLKARSCIGMAAELGGVVVGYVVYELAKDSLIVLRMAVDEKHRRQGIGRALIQRLKNKLSQQRRKGLAALVPDTDTDAHLFLKANGFKAKRVLRSDVATERDLYDFRYSHGDGDCETRSTEQSAEV